MLEKVAKMVESKEHIFMLNIAADQEIGERYEIRGTPTFILFLNGQGIGMVEAIAPDLSSLLAAVTEPINYSGEEASRLADRESHKAISAL